MRIAAVSPAYPLRGGMAHYMALLYRVLVARGHQVLVVSFSRQYPSLFFPGRTQSDLSRHGIPIPAEPLLDSVNPFTWARTAWRIRAWRPDALVLNYWMPFFLPAYAAVARGVRLGRPTRVIFLCHNVVPHEPRPGDRLLSAWGLRAGHAFVVQSTSVRDDLLRVIPDARYVLVPHPVYDVFEAQQSVLEARRTLGLAPDDRVVLFFGYVRRYKGLSVLLRAVASLKETMPVRLVVAGEFYEDIQGYQREVASLGIAPYVTLIDRYIPNEEVGTFFVASDVVVLPYLSATQSGVLQIAYHFDRPVIVTATGGLAEAVEEGKTGFVVPPGDPEALAAAIRTFFQVRAGHDFAAHVRAHKGQFSWERLAEAIEQLVERTELP